MADYFSHSHSRISESSNNDDHDDDKIKLNFQQLVVAGDGSSPASSSARKPRGRPLGSKNKPKPPVIITKESPSAMNPMFLEISPNADVLDAVLAFARRRRSAVSILAGTGPVANVSLRHPSGHNSAVTYSGTYEMLSLLGSFLPAGSNSTMRSFAPFTISLAGPQGQMIGGMVSGTLLAAGTVVLTAAEFICPEFHRLPLSDGGEDQEERVARDVHLQAVKVEAEVGPSSAGGPQYQHHEMALWGSPAAAHPHLHRPQPPAHH